MRTTLRSAWLSSVVAVVLLAGAAPVAATPVGVASAVANGPSAVSPNSGTSTTSFSLSLGANPACPGDAATGGYRWHTFLVAAQVEVSSLTFGSNGPLPPAGGAVALPLFTALGGEPVVNQLPNQAISPGGPGGITGIPLMSFGELDNTILPAGQYSIGVACTQGVAGPTQLKSYWTSSLRIISGPAGPSFSTAAPATNNGAMTLSVPAGDSSTPFAVGLGATAACPADSTSGGMRWQTFMVPAGTDLSTLTFTTNGPSAVTGQFRSPLFSVAGDPLVNQLTDQAVAPGGPGGISAIPSINFAVFGPGEIPAGQYTIGVACTTGVVGPDQLQSYWSAPLSSAANPQGTDPAQIRWVGVPKSPIGLSATVPTTGTVELVWGPGGADNGAGTSSYEVSNTSTGLVVCTTSGTGCTIPGLDPLQSVTFTVVAISAVGTSPPSAPVTVLPTALPGQPNTPSVATAVGGIRVTVVQPSSGGAPASFVATASPGGATCSVIGSSGSCTITGLSGSQEYTVTVIASNAAGNSSPSDPSAAVTPSTAPGAPTGVSGVAGDRQVTVSWSAPADDGGFPVIDYVVTASPGGATCTAVAPDTSCVVSGLTNGVGYTFTVVASSEAGVGTASAPSQSVVPRSVPRVPGAPTGVIGAAGERQVTVSWSAPGDDGGFPVIDYVVTASPGGATCTAVAPDTSCVVSGLTNGVEYTFTVVASNSLGVGAASTPSGPVTPRTVPGAPTGVTGEAGDRQATVSWSAPGEDGGSPVTGYVVTASPGGATCTAVAPDTSCVVSGLTNGVEYTFTVAASNVAGGGAASAPSESVTPRFVPGEEIEPISEPGPAPTPAAASGAVAVRPSFTG